MICKDEIENILDRQLSSLWQDMYQKKLISEVIPRALDKVYFCCQSLSITRCYDGIKVSFSPYDTVQWSVFLYYLSNLLWKKAYINEATVVYYLNKVMHSVDWFYEIELPDHFWAEHPHNSILGKAVYGDYFFAFHGTTVGANYKCNGFPVYPTLENNVFMCANSTILGDCHIGNNVIVSANTYIKDQNVPDNSIVFSQSGGGIIVKRVDELQIKARTSAFWRWDT